MSRAGRKSKYDPESTPQLAEEYASELLTDAQISSKLGIHVTTFMEWQKKHAEFSLAVKRGKAVANEKLISAMQKTAEGYYKDAIALPPDDELLSELASVKYKVDARGAIQIESKDEMRKRLGHSPDRADAVVLAFANLEREGYIAGAGKMYVSEFF